MSFIPWLIIIIFTVLFSLIIVDSCKLVTFRDRDILGVNINDKAECVQKCFGIEPSGVDYCSSLKGAGLADGADVPDVPDVMDNTSSA